MTITEFLSARLAEDEAVAREATPGPWAAQTMAAYLVYGDPDGGGMFVAQTAAGGVTDEQPIDDALHIERFNPARVLAEVEAKRRLIDFAYDYAEIIDGEWGCVHGSGEIRRGKCPYAQKVADEALCLLALPYADHPDYDEAWRV